ncbi:MAG: ribonuclease P protein component [Gemmatimonadaceae bacterium]
MREGKRARTSHLDVRALTSPLSHPRVGIIVAKRKRTAVDRNRVKRRIREAVRLHVLPGSDSMDMVIRAREEAYTASFETLSAELVDAARRLKRMLERSSSAGS